MSAPESWKNTVVRLFHNNDPNFLTKIENSGKHIENLSIELDQHEKVNRENGCKIIASLSKISDRKLTSLSIRFCGENPLFYAGNDFIEALNALFGPCPGGKIPPYQLHSVDLRHLPIGFTDTLFDLLSENNPNLEMLNVQNKVLICKFSPSGLLRLVKRCRKLRDLSVYFCSLSSHILVALSAKDREKMQNLSIMCRHEQRFLTDIPKDAWTKFAQSNPSVKITLGFDHTCPLNVLSIIMKPEIPVSTLLLETQADIASEVKLAASYFGYCLQHVTIRASSSNELEVALLELAKSCNRLQTLKLFCSVRKDTVDRIKLLRPNLNATNFLVIT